MQNLNSFLYAPVMAGFWSHRDIVEDVFTYDDLLDAHEMMQVQSENEHRAVEAAKKEGNG